MANSITCGGCWTGSEPRRGSAERYHEFLIRHARGDFCNYHCPDVEAEVSLWLTKTVRPRMPGAAARYSSPPVPKLPEKSRSFAARSSTVPFTVIRALFTPST